MQVVIRVDASTRIGLGHLMRCRTLANALTAKGASVMFVTYRGQGHGIDLLRADEFNVHELPAPEIKPVTDADYAGWLGVPMTVDAKQTLAALPDRVDWLVVDHYGLDAQWETELRAQAQRIFVIDDLDNRAHDADVLLDQNYSGPQTTRYDARVSDHCIKLLGPRFALLHPAFREYQLAKAAPGLSCEAIERIFVFFGGTDPDNLTGRALEALCASNLAHISVDCVMGANNPHRANLLGIAERRGNVRMHPPQPHLAALMAEADLAIGAGGATTWERCALGLPSLVVSIAENQRPACELLFEDGYIHYLGHHDAVTACDIAAAVHQLIDSADQRRQLAKASAQLVDGQGTQRVVDCMFSMVKGQSAACH